MFDQRNDHKNAEKSRETGLLEEDPVRDDDDEGTDKNKNLGRKTILA